MNNNNNNNNISKKVAGYCVASFCVTLSMSKELNSGLLRDKYIYMLFFEVRLEHRIAIPVYWLLSHAVTSPRRYKPIRNVELFWF